MLGLETEKERDHVPEIWDGEVEILSDVTVSDEREKLGIRGRRTSHTIKRITPKMMKTAIRAENNLRNKVGRCWGW